MLGLKRKTAELEEAEPPVQSYPERRREELSLEIERLGDAMASLDSRMRLFREKNFALVNGKLVWRLSGIADQPAAEAELRSLEKERDALLL